LCLDNEDVRAAAERFLRALVEHYRDHPGLGGYDIWNECNIPAAYCFCPATAERFREWLQAKYGEVGALAKAWRRYSIAAWADAQPPRTLAPYPDVLDWLQFRIDNAYRLMRWRADLIRGLDSEHPVTAHGVAMSLSRMADGACHEWRAAAEAESYGFTWVASRQGNQPWKQWHAVDLVRAGSRGKPFWHAEAQAGPLWMQPQVIGREREDGRISEPEDIRLWNLISFAGGATGLLYPRWRPLLDGPLFGAFGAYGMDGSRTPRSEMVS
jgi:beta-galactosidase